MNFDIRIVISIDQCASFVAKMRGKNIGSKLNICRSFNQNSF